ncbi:uncharacterized protein LOC120473900 [Pimephales promelas]|uniref:uncharacterized protein LOC120473900 n=1 Tax=Pimephales promelas TaxID=90988 RepID=UPI001955708B|nr:uncharacterized protein LOC120473900 [Pimephales promelas]
MIPLGCKNPEIRHVMSFRRQALMILNSQSDPLNLSVKLSIEGKDYTVFISSESMKCFVCGEFGHVRQTCPRRDGPDPAAGVESTERAAGAEVAAAAVASEPLRDGALSALGDVPEGRSVLEASGNGLETAVEEVAGPSHAPTETQPETSPGQVGLKPVPETDLSGDGGQSQLDRSVSDTEEAFKQCNVDMPSQNPVDLMEDSDNDHDDTELMRDYAVDSDIISGEGSSPLSQHSEESLQESQLPSISQPLEAALRFLIEEPQYSNSKTKSYRTKVLQKLQEIVDNQQDILAMQRQLLAAVAVTVTEEGGEILENGPCQTVDELKILDRELENKEKSAKM